MTRTTRSLVAILSLVSIMLPGLAWPGATASADPAILQIQAAMAAAPDGRGDFFILFRERADLGPAGEIRDWQSRGRFVYERLQETAARSQARVRAGLDARGISYRSYFIDNSIYLTADWATLQWLATLPEVAGFRANEKLTLESPVGEPVDLPAAAIPWNISKIGADQVWQDFGVKGQGILIGEIDTGVEYTHDALFVNYKCGAGPHDDCWYDPTGACPSAPCDQNGRGTHIMGTLVGDDNPALPYNAGVAPDAQWIACAACTPNGCSYDTYIACAQWMLAPNGDPAKRPHVVNISVETPRCDEWYRPSIQAWVAAGMVPAASCGGLGPSCTTITAPGGYPESFATCPTDPDDNIYWTSGRGPSCFGEIKPEVSAPGANICSSVPGNGWNCGFSGNSFCPAHTAGLVALLWSADPSLIGDIATTEAIITSTAVCHDDLVCGGNSCPGPNNIYGYGRIDAYAAVQAVWSCEPVTLTAFSWTPVTPTAGQVVTFTGSASGTAPILFDWHFGDSGAGSGMTVTHAYTVPGSYAVRLAAGNACGEQAVTHTLAVLPAPCAPVTQTAFAWVPPIPTAGQVVTFTGSASGTAPLTFTWGFGDGSLPLVGETVTHTYAGPGWYTVTMTATNPCGGAAIARAVEVVAACAPVTQTAFAWVPPIPTAGQVVTFTGSASGTAPILFDWQFGDGGAASGMTVTHAYTLPGTYAVRLAAGNACGEQVVTHTLAVLPVPCAPVTQTAFAWTPPTPTVGQVVTFTGTATGTLPITYTWGWGDGLFFLAPCSLPLATCSFTHTYAQAGRYTVTLTATNGCGGAVAVQAVDVAAAPQEEWQVYLPLVSRP